MNRRELLRKLLLLFFPKVLLLEKAATTSKKAFEAVEKSSSKMKMQRPQKVALASGGVLIFIVAFGWFLFPAFLSNMIKNTVNLKPGNEIRSQYLKVPFAVDFKIYVFNITNPLAVTENGAKPIVQEIGPYCYEEWKEKVDVEDDDEDDTITYTMKDTFIYRRDLTEPKLSGREVITIPHPLYAGLVMAVERENKGALPLIAKALTSIHRNAQTAFLTATVEDILFKGIPILCNVTDFPGKSLCSQLKAQSKDLVEIEPGILMFSLFGGKNGSLGARLKVHRGIKDIMDLGRIVEFNGKKELSIWSEPRCNKINYGDTSVFPPGLPIQDLTMFTGDLCRSLSAYYIEDAYYAGIPVRKYSADFGDQMNNKRDKCYCGKKCMRKGVFDLHKCVGAPMVTSLPHFYLADQSYVDGVIGLHPNENDHEIYLYFEHITGAQLAAKKRMQFSLALHSVSKIHTMKNLPNTLVPMFWVEEGVELNSTWTDPLKNQLFRMIKIINISKYVILVASSGGLILAGLLSCKKKTETSVKIPATARIDQITPINRAVEENKNPTKIDVDIGNTNQVIISENDNYL